jgi:hypothetical protein
VIRNATTHDVRIDRSREIVVKRFLSSRRGEPVREWTALTLLAAFAPGLAPAPVSADLTGDPPTLTMSLLPGTGLGAARLTAAQASALAGSLDRLWRSVPFAEREFSPAGRIRLVDFEDCGPSDRAFELAILTEHLSAWSEAGLDAEGFLGLFGLSPAEQARVRDFRRLAALFWLIMLRPGGASSARNPPGTLERQAHRLLGLLG